MVRASPSARRYLGLMAPATPAKTVRQPDGLTVAVRQWFTKRGFTETVFLKDKLTIHTNVGGQVLVFKLQERPGYRTLYRETKGGALIVFEVKVDGERILWDGYCPLLIFSLWTVKLTFKPRAPILKYRAEGYQIAMAFREVVRGWQDRA